MGFFEILLGIALALLASVFVGTLMAVTILVPFSKKFSVWPKYTNIVVWVCVGIVFLIMGCRLWYGNHQAGSFFECDNYQNELYHAHLYTDNSNIKNYDVVVDLDREDAEYYVDKVYFNKRQYITVYNWIDAFKVGEKIWFEEEDGREWYLELTNKKADKIPE